MSKEESNFKEYRCGCMLNQNICLAYLSFRQLLLRVIQPQFRLYISLQMTQTMLKEGTVVTYQVMQNTITYQVRLSLTPKGLWMCIQQSGQIWKLTISHEMIEQIVSKASGGKQTLTFKQFTTYLLQSINKNTQKWSLGIMTPIQLQVLRGGAASKHVNNTKIYMILSDKDKKFHYPFTFVMTEINEKQKLIEAIKMMKHQLEQLKIEKSDKSHSSFSILNDVYLNSEQLKLENEEIKKKIKIYEESLSQKRGAVEIDIILKQKGNYQMLAETKKRQEIRQINRMKNIYIMMERETTQVRNQVELINRQLILLEDSVGNAAKLKSHAMKVIKASENQLRTHKKVLQKQLKEIQNIKRNLMSSKNNEKKVLTKIKQIQIEIDQSKKKANIKEISNRLYAGSVDSPSSKSQSIGSSVGKPASNASSNSNKGPGNIVRENMLKKNIPSTGVNRANLLKTSPNINQNQQFKRGTEKQIPERNINSSHEMPKNTTTTRLHQTQKYRSGSQSEKSNSNQKKQISVEQKQKQRKAMQRLSGGKRVLNQKNPSEQKPVIKSKEKERSSNQKYGQNISSNKYLGKKDNTKQMLTKMKEIKDQYNNRSKNINNKPASNAQVIQRK